MSDPLKGKYTQKRYFREDYVKAQDRLRPIGVTVTPGVHDYEAFIAEGPGLRLIFYPHRTTAGNYHIRVRKGGACDVRRLQDAIFALAENMCTFTYPADYKLHQDAVRAAIERTLRGLSA